MSGRLVALEALVTSVAVAGGCTTTNTPSDHPDDAHHTNATEGDAGQCTDSLANVSATSGMVCPDTYEGAVAFVCGIPFSFAPTLLAGQCGGLAAVAYSWGNHWKVCVYDGVDSGTLVGAEAEDDVTTFCNKTSFTVLGGQVPDSCQGSLAISPLLATLDASCPAADAATDAPTDSSDGPPD